MSYKLIQQVIILALSFGIIFLFIQPKLIELREVQSEVSQYGEAIANATQFADLLQTQLNQVTTISRADDQALETFLPRTLDHIAVARDLQTIASRSGIQTLALSYGDAETDAPVREIQASDSFIGSEGDTLDFEPPTESPTVLTRTLFTLEVQGTYTQFVRFLRALEANVYPLFVTDIAIGESSLPEELQTSDPVAVYTLGIEVVSLESSL